MDDQLSSPHDPSTVQTSAPDVDEDLALDDEDDGESEPRKGAIAAPPPPPPAAPAPPPLLASAPIVSTLPAAAGGVPGGSFRAIASGNTVASSLRDRLASTKLKKVVCSSALFWPSHTP